MGQSRHHYERAFDAYLREISLPHLSVSELRRGILPPGHKLAAAVRDGDGGETVVGLKSFDFVLHGGAGGLLVDVKGRKTKVSGSASAAVTGRLESWVTLDDIESMLHWRDLFGPGFQAAFVFLYWCDAIPPAGLFPEVFAHEERWYGLRAVELDAYRGAMTLRSPRWRTVHLPRHRFAELGRPLIRSADEARARPA